MIYRILTENKNRESIRKEVSRHFDGFTDYVGTGVYKGTRESSLTIEIDTFDDDNYIAIQKIAIYIKKLNSQECVLVQRIKSESKLV